MLKFVLILQLVSGESFAMPIGNGAACHDAARALDMTQIKWAACVLDTSEES